MISIIPGTKFVSLTSPCTEVSEWLLPPPEQDLLALGVVEAGSKHGWCLFVIEALNKYWRTLIW